MRLDEEKVAEVLALSEPERAYLAHQLIASLDPQQDNDAKEEWQQVLDRRSQEIELGRADCRPIKQTLLDIRTKLNAGRQPS